jgi:hypothetical protein
VEEEHNELGKGLWFEGAINWFERATKKDGLSKKE